MRAQIKQFLRHLGVGRPDIMEDPDVAFGLIKLDETNFSLTGIQELLEMREYDAKLINGDHLLVEKNGAICELRIDQLSKMIWLSVAYVFKDTVSEEDRLTWLKRNFKKYGFADVSIRNSRLILIEKLDDLYLYPSEYMIRRISFFMGSSVYLNQDSYFQ